MDAEKNSNSFSDKTVKREFNITGQELVPSMTIRHHFAAMARQGVLANSSLHMSLVDDCKIAVAAADALIAELNKPTEQEG